MHLNNWKLDTKSVNPIRVKEKYPSPKNRASVPNYFSTSQYSTANENFYLFLSNY